MPLPTTLRAENELNKTNIEPRYVLCVDGLADCLSTGSIQELIRIGDEGLFIDGSWSIGGTRDLDGQIPIISFSGTTSKISQQIRNDRGNVTSVSNMNIRLVDKNNFASELISPGVKIPEILSTRCEFFVGFGASAFPDDYLKIFAGNIVETESGAGFVVLKLNHADEAKRENVFSQVKRELSASMNASQTSLSYTASLGDSEFLLPGDALRTFVKVDQEFIEYTGKTSTTLTGLIRGSLTVDGGTAPAAHDNEESIESYYMLEGNPIELALKIMLSGAPAQFADSIAVKNFGIIDPAENIEGSIWLEAYNIQDKTGLVAGDTVIVTGATNAANNGTFIITEVVINNFGSYLVVDNVAAVLETNSSAVLSLESKYNVFPEGFGLKMLPIEVDIEQHEKFLNGFLASAPDVRLIMSDSMDGNEIIDEQLYLPIAGYSIPRKTKSSMGAYRPPLSDEELITLNTSNIRNPASIKIKRSLTKNYYSTVKFNYDLNVLDDEYSNDEAKTDLVVDKSKTYTINAMGYRSELGGAAAAINTSNRILKRFRGGAEFIDGLRVLFNVGVLIEPGDIVLVDFDDLFVTEIADGTRNKKPVSYEVANRSFDLKTGDVSLDLIDTAFSDEFRYARISPSSFIKSGVDASNFNIEASFSKPFGQNEWRKWRNLIGASVRVFSTDFSSSDTGQISAITGNKITLVSPLSFTPSAGMVMTLSDYTGQPDIVKTKYVFFTDGTNPFPDGGEIYVFI